MSKFEEMYLNIQSKYLGEKLIGSNEIYWRIQDRPVLYQKQQIDFFTREFFDYPCYVINDPEYYIHSQDYGLIDKGGYKRNKLSWLLKLKLKTPLKVYDSLSSSDTKSFIDFARKYAQASLLKMQNPQSERLKELRTSKDNIKSEFREVLKAIASPKTDIYYNFEHYFHLYNQDGPPYISWLFDLLKDYDYGGFAQTDDTNQHRSIGIFDINDLEIIKSKQLPDNITKDIFSNLFL